MTALYQLAHEFRDTAAKLEDLDLPPEVIEDTLEGMAFDLETKATQVACFFRNLEATAAAIKDAEAQMATRRRAIENRVARLKDYLLANMMIAGVQKIECPLFKLSVRDNPAAVEVYESALIPAQFMRQPEPPPPAVDKAAIKEALAAGQDVPGCKLTRGKRLELR